MSEKSQRRSQKWNKVPEKVEKKIYNSSPVLQDEEVRKYLKDL